MRWEALFADLENQFRQAAHSVVEEEVTDLAEAERGQVDLADRLRARLGQDLALRLRDGSDVRGTVLDAAVQWLLVLTGSGRRVLVPVGAIAVARGLGHVAPEASVVERRLRLGHVLRALSREEVVVLVRTTVGDHRGRIAAVAADHIDLAPATAGSEETVSLALAHVLSVATT